MPPLSIETNGAESRDCKNPLLFECAWEVANKGLSCPCRCPRSSRSPVAASEKRAGNTLRANLPAAMFKCSSPCPADHPHASRRFDPLGEPCETPSRVFPSAVHIRKVRWRTVISARCAPASASARSLAAFELHSGASDPLANDLTPRSWRPWRTSYIASDAPCTRTDYVPVGGIYTVIKTKIPVTVAEYGDRYCLIGPLSYKTAPMEVEAIEPVEDPALAGTLASMRDQGCKILYGRWLVEGAPRVLLFDTGSMYHRLDEWKADLWNLTGIPTPPNDHESNETIVFGYLVAWFLGEFVARQLDTAVVAHFHEWQAGLAIPLCRKRHIDVTTVFTTHATLLGRYLCAGSTDFYNNLQFFDVDHEAGKRGIYHRYCIERSAAHSSDVFTTVSHITAFESEHLLKRKPDGVLPNGLNVVKFSAMHEFQNLHAKSKEKINDFVRGHFYGHYDFDLENTLYVRRVVLPFQVMI